MTWNYQYLILNLSSLLVYGATQCCKLSGSTVLKYIRTRTSMQTTQYLYDLEPTVLVTMLYPDALSYKLTAARTLIGKLLEPHYTERDDVRLSAVIRAEKHNLALLEELSSNSY